jgi:hypothetical protein
VHDSRRRRKCDVSDGEAREVEHDALIFRDKRNEHAHCRYAHICGDQRRVDRCKERAECDVHRRHAKVDGDRVCDADIDWILAAVSKVKRAVRVGVRLVEKSRIVSSVEQYVHGTNA